MWPGITPVTVWDLELADWLLFAPAADDWSKDRKKNN